MTYSYYIGLLSNLSFDSVMAWVFLAITILIVGAVICAALEMKKSSSVRDIVAASALHIIALFVLGLVGFLLLLIEYLIIKSVISDYSSN